MNAVQRTDSDNSIESLRDESVITIRKEIARLKCQTIMTGKSVKIRFPDSGFYWE